MGQDCARVLQLEWLGGTPWGGLSGKGNSLMKVRWGRNEGIAKRNPD